MHSWAVARNTMELLNAHTSSTCCMSPVIHSFKDQYLLVALVVQWSDIHKGGQLCGNKRSFLSVLCLSFLNTSSGLGNPISSGSTSSHPLAHGWLNLLLPRPVIISHTVPSAPSTHFSRPYWSPRIFFCRFVFVGRCLPDEFHKKIWFSL